MKIFKLMCLLLPCAALQADMEQAFKNFYDQGTWSESGFSLSGSQIELMGDYVTFLQNFLKEHEVCSVVDIGCGDWAFSCYVDWEGIEYLGIDVVKFVVDRNVCLFSAPNIQFSYGNALEMGLPEADLLICKDVFQHLSNKDIFKMMEQFHKFKHCLITDFVDFETFSSLNLDIVTGGYHCVDLTKPPFNANGKRELTFFSVGAKQTIHIQPNAD